MTTAEQAPGADAFTAGPMEHAKTGMQPIAFTDEAIRQGYHLLLRDVSNDKEEALNLVAQVSRRTVEQVRTILVCDQSRCAESAIDHAKTGIPPIAFTDEAIRQGYHLLLLEVSNKEEALNLVAQVCRRAVEQIKAILKSAGSTTAAPKAEPQARDPKQEEPERHDEAVEASRKRTGFARSRLDGPFQGAARDATGDSIRVLLLRALPLLAILMRLTTFQRRRDANDFADVDGSSMIQMLLVMGLLVLLFGSPRGLECLRGSWRGPWLGFWLYSVWCACSAFWSGAAIFSLYRCLELATIAWYCLYLMASAKSEVEAKFAAVAIGTVSVGLDVAHCGGVTSLFFRGMHVNSFTCGAAMLLCLSLSMHKQGGWFPRLCTLFLALAIYGGTSGGSNLATVFALIVYLSCSRGGNSRVLLVLLACIALIAFFAGALGKESLMEGLLPGKTEKNVSTLTGRTNLWEFYWQGFLNRPWLGYGYVVGEKRGDLLGFQVMSSAHNLIMSVAINTGIVGMAIYAFFLGSVMLWTARASRRGERTGDAVAVLACSVASLTNAMTAPVLGSHFWAPTISIFLVWAYADRFIWAPVWKARERGFPRWRDSIAGARVPGRDVVLRPAHSIRGPA